MLCQTPSQEHYFTTKKKCALRNVQLRKSWLLSTTAKRTHEPRAKKKKLISHFAMLKIPNEVVYLFFQNKNVKKCNTDIYIPLNRHKFSQNKD